MAKTRVSKRTYWIESVDAVSVGDKHVNYTDAAKALTAISKPGTYRICCCWPDVTLVLAEPKLVRTVAEPTGA